ncbi:hypothetical protein D3C87_1298490 [compost metagenome]
MATMMEHQFRHGIHMRHGHRRGTVPRGQRARGAQHDEIRPHAIHRRRQAQRADMGVHGIGEIQPAERPARLHDLRRQRLLGRRHGGAERLRVGIEGQPGAHDGLPRDRVGVVVERQRKAEAVQQLRAQLALLRIHRADEHEARRVLVGHAIALHHVHTAGRHVEQLVHQRVRQQVDFIHIQHALVRARQQARREAHLALLQHVAQVQRAGQLLLAGA